MCAQGVSVSSICVIVKRINTIPQNVLQKLDTLMNGSATDLTQSEKESANELLLNIQEPKDFDKVLDVFNAATTRIETTQQLERLFVQ